MDVAGIEDAVETSNSQSQGLDDLYKATLSETGQSYELPFPIQTVECYTSSVGDHYENEGSNSVLDLDKGQVQIIKVQQSYACDSHILQQYLNESVILRSDGNSYPNEITIIPETRPPTMDDFDFNSSDSFSSTESIIPKSIQCPKCPKRFMFKSDLTRHDKHKHAVKQKLTCTVCKKEFFSQQNLRFHEKSHRPSVDIVCFVCKKTFRSQTVYNKHMAERHKSLQLKTDVECDVCGKVCVGRLAIEAHAKSHGPEAHICEVCGKMFRKLSAYKMHVMKHEKTETESSEEIHQCHLCPVSFYEKTNLDLHLKTHVPAHTCKTCNATFNTAQELNKHVIKTHNRSQIKLPCPHCTKFYSKSTLKQHIKTAHKTSMQESCTQTGEDLQTTYEIPNVNMVLHPTITSIDGSQSIILTPVANFGEVTTINSLPIIIGRSPSVPFSTAS